MAAKIGFRFQPSITKGKPYFGFSLGENILQKRALLVYLYPGIGEFARICGHPSAIFQIVYKMLHVWRWLHYFIPQVPITSNLIDVLWEDKPPPSNATVTPHPLKYSGILININIVY